MFNEEIIQEIKNKLCSRNDTIAVAESVTGGLLQSAFSNAEEASMFFQGGISAYNVGQKVKHLQVEPIHAIKYNSVSQNVAMEMALHVCKMFLSSWGISITGYAVPVAESGNQLYAYYAIVSDGIVRADGKLQPPSNDPLQVKLFYVTELLKRLNQLL